MTTNSKILVVSLFFGLNYSLHADTAYIAQAGHNRLELSESLTDVVRENMIHIFDSAGRLPIMNQKQIEEDLEKIKSGSFIEVALDEPARIFVANTELKATHLWASVIDSNGMLSAWVLKQPNGQLVSLNKPQGVLALQFAPTVLDLLKLHSEQAGTGHPLPAPESKSQGSDKPQPESEMRSR